MESICGMALLANEERVSDNFRRKGAPRWGKWMGITRTRDWLGDGRD